MAEGKYVTPMNLELKDPSSSEDDASTLRASRDSREKDLVRLAMEKAEWECVQGCCGTGDQPSDFISTARSLWIEETEIRGVEE